MPKWIGYFHILRETFRLVYGSSEEESAKRQKRFEENRDLPKDLGNWQMTYSIHPDHGRKGVMHVSVVTDDRISASFFERRRAFL